MVKIDFRGKAAKVAMKHTEVRLCLNNPLKRLLPQKDLQAKEKGEPSSQQPARLISNNATLNHERLSTTST